MKRYFIRAAAVGAVLALPLLGASAASAGNHIPKAPTPGCNLTDPQCAEPVVAQSAIPGDDGLPTADFAMTYTGPDSNFGVPGGAVSISTNNDIENGTQDWQFVQIGTVPAPGTDPPFGFGLNAADLQLYGNDPTDPTNIFLLEFTPFGQSTNLCAAANKSNKMVLQNCSGAPNQDFLITDDPPFLNESTDISTFDYEYALLAKHNISAQHHPCLTAPTAQVDLSGRLTVAQCQFEADGVATDQMWSAIP
jgi:hypothetical protein